MALLAQRALQPRYPPLLKLRMNGLRQRQCALQRLVGFLGTLQLQEYEPKLGLRL